MISGAQSQSGARARKKNPRETKALQSPSSKDPLLWTNMTKVAIDTLGRPCESGRSRPIPVSQVKRAQIPPVGSITGSPPLPSPSRNGTRGEARTGSAAWGRVWPSPSLGACGKRAHVTSVDRARHVEARVAAHWTSLYPISPGGVETGSSVCQQPWLCCEGGESDGPRG